MYMCVIMSLPWKYIHCTVYEKKGGREETEEGMKERDKERKEGMEVKKGRREGDGGEEGKEGRDGGKEGKEGRGRR